MKYLVTLVHYFLYMYMFYSESLQDRKQGRQKLSEGACIFRKS